jgi:Antirestriction protein (ArdA)
MVLQQQVIFINCQQRRNTMATLHAQPYNPDATGFYFESAEEFTSKAEGLTDCHGSPVEEFEIQFIDGHTGDAQLFEACSINQANLDVWFDEIETLDPREKVALFYLVDGAGYDLEQAQEKIYDVVLYECRLREAAEEIFDECHLESIPEGVRYYIDYEKYARDLEQGGELTEIEFANAIYTVNAGAL